MGRSAKIDYQAVLEKNLIGHPDGLPLDELLERSGLKVDRSTLFRHLARLIEKGRVERVGKARASRYRPLNIARMDTYPESTNTQRPAAQPIPEIAERQPRNERPLSTSGEAHQIHQSGRAEPDNMPVATPDYGTAVRKAVRTVIRDWKRCDEVNLRIYLSLLVKPEHVEEVAAAVKIELAALHEGNLDGYGLSPADLSRFIAAASSKATGG